MARPADGEPSCPNFTSIPQIRSDRPAFEAHYPHLLERLEREAHVGGRRHNPTAMPLASMSGTSGSRQGQRDTTPGD